MAGTQGEGAQKPQSVKRRPGLALFFSCPSSPLGKAGGGTPDYRCAITFWVEEKSFYRESQTTKPAALNCPFCKTADTYDLRWLVRKKIDRLPGGADERDRAKFAKFASYMVLMDDKADCKNMRCRKRFEISGIRTTAFI